MKRKLIALAIMAFSITADAEAIMWTNNTDGGKIVLTNERCSNKTGSIAYILSQTSDTIMGCWTNDSVAIHVLWSGQYLRSYDYNGWTVVKKDPTM